MARPARRHNETPPPSPAGESTAPISGMQDTTVTQSQQDEVDAVRQTAQKKRKEAKANPTRLPTAQLQAKDVWPDAPLPELLIPASVTAHADGRITITRGQGERQEIIVVSPDPIIPVHRYVQAAVDGDEPHEQVELAFRRQGRWQRVIVPRGEIADKRKLLQLADRGVYATNDTSGALSNYLMSIEHLNLDRIPRTAITTHLGWLGDQGELGFVWGREHIAPEDAEQVKFRGETPGETQIAHGYRAAGTMAGWIEAVARAAQYPRVMAMLYAGLSAPLLRIVAGGSNFILDLAGRTSTGKTTSLRVAASAWGNPDERSPEAAMGTWDATKVWLERASAVLGSLPLILDDTARAKDKRGIADMLYTVASGHGRGRGIQRGLGYTGTWRTVMLSTGEAPATSFTQDGGTRARCIELRGLPFGQPTMATQETVRAITLGVLANYGHAGPAMVRWLVDHRSRWHEVQEWYDAANARYAVEAPDSVAARVAAYAAVIDTAARLIHEVLPLPWSYADPMEPLWKEIAAEAQDAAGAERALMEVLSWAWSHERSFFGREGGLNPSSQPMSGRWDNGDAWDSIDWYPTVLSRVLTDLGYQPEAILDDWRDRGWLLTDGDRKRYTRRLRLNGDRPHVVSITREAIEEVEGVDVQMPVHDASDEVQVSQPLFDNNF